HSQIEKASSFEVMVMKGLKHLKLMQMMIQIQLTYHSAFSNRKSKLFRSNGNERAKVSQTNANDDSNASKPIILHSQIEKASSFEVMVMKGLKHLKLMPLMI
ncbi:hypothetical protein, partial [Escherichia coli]|uniref:hypothetical protein n=1 Tax=Escherichia coli TaxID=562 RepID=UPI001AA14D21